jgi:hypothetical protein
MKRVDVTLQAASAPDVLPVPRTTIAVSWLKTGMMLLMPVVMREVVADVH